MSSSTAKPVFDFTGKVILITGSSSGIGAACARKFAQAGGKVVITGYETNDVISVVAEIEQITGVKPFSKAGNLLEEGFIESLIEGTIKAYGQIDVLVNNAGWISAEDSFESEAFIEQYDKIMGLNLRSALKLMYACKEHLGATKGAIVNTASVCGLNPLEKPIYCASKAALIMATQCAALQLGKLGIRANCVSPGPIATPIGRYVGQPEMMLFDDGRCPETELTILKRNGRPEEVASVVLFLACNEASGYVTGVNYVVDGGYMCH